jgi:hypothetical protein
MFRRRPPEPAPNLLDLTPVQLAPWEERDGRAVVERLVPAAGGAFGWLLSLSFLTGVKKLRLDDVGSAVWRRCDGRHTVRQIAALLRDEFGAACEPAENRLQTFFTLLRRERLVGYLGHDDEAIADWRTRPQPGRITEVP